LFQTKLAELGHPQVKVRIIEAAAAGPMADGPTAPATPAAKPGIETAPPRPKGEAVSSGKEDFKKDPLIEKALEIFKGQIVETRS